MFLIAYKGECTAYDFTELLNREQTIHKAWYISYFEELTAFNHPLMYALDTFAYNISNDSALNSNYASANDWGNLVGCTDELFVSYDNFIVTQLSSVSISWYRIRDTDTSFISSLRELAIAIDEPTRTSSYIQNVITENYAEIDQTIVWVDTLVAAAFGVQFQFDSTVVFQNHTEPLNAGNSYSWNFGDASAYSTEEHPIHEFPMFDTTYLVCLWVTNECGTSNFCDTIYIDSAHWGGSFKTSNVSTSSLATTQTKGSMEAIIYPNPAQSFVILAYRFAAAADLGALLITDSHGKLLFEKDLKQQKSQLMIPTDNFAPGIYFYVLRSQSGDTLQGRFVKY